MALPSRFRSVVGGERARTRFSKIFNFPRGALLLVVGVVNEVRSLELCDGWTTSKTVSVDSSLTGLSTKNKRGEGLRSSCGVWKGAEPVDQCLPQYFIAVPGLPAGRWIEGWGHCEGPPVDLTFAPAVDLWWRMCIPGVSFTRLFQLRLLPMMRQTFCDWRHPEINYVLKAFFLGHLCLETSGIYTQSSFLIKMPMNLQ